MTNIKHNDLPKIPPLENTYSGLTHEDKIEAIKIFAAEVGAHFPQLLDTERDKSAAHIHISNIEEQLKRSRPDFNAIVHAIEALLKMADKTQDDMMAAALLDYMDEIIELIGSK